MKTATKILASLTAVIGLIAPVVTPVIAAWVSAHPTTSVIIGAISTILALFHQPSASV